MHAGPGIPAPLGTKRKTMTTPVRSSRENAGGGGLDIFVDDEFKAGGGGGELSVIVMYPVADGLALDVRLREVNSGKTFCHLPCNSTPLPQMSPNDLVSVRVLCRRTRGPGIHGRPHRRRALDRPGIV